MSSLTFDCQKTYDFDASINSFASSALNCVSVRVAQAAISTQSIFTAPIPPDLHNPNSKAYVIMYGVNLTAGNSLHL